MDNATDSTLCLRIADRLKNVGGVIGVVLGGSRARGTATADSDFDIGVYYADENALDLPALAETARVLDDERREALIAPPGGWGRWVNGGGWLVVDGRRVDVILRDLGRVRRAVDDSLAGRVDAHYQTGHPHAFINVMYAGEVAMAKILADGGGELGRLKARTLPYPAELKKALISLFGFEAGFSAMLARNYADSDDSYYVAAHILRSLSCLNQVLFAVNGEYCLNEKKAVGMADGFALKPRDYARRVDSVVSLMGGKAGEACRELDALIGDARLLLPAEADS
jgi:Predicted nucleotidyltransferases